MIFSFATNEDANDFIGEELLIDKERRALYGLNVHIYLIYLDITIILYHLT